MDDDFSFGNVWGDSSSPKPLPASLLAGPPKASVTAAAPAAAFDDFDDFADFNDAPTATSASAAQAPAANGFAAAGDDDDFGDFGDFGDVPAATTSASAAFDQPQAAFDDDDGFGTFGTTTFQTPPLLSIKTQRDWQPLQLDPVPRLSDLAELVDEILEPLWERLRDDVFTDEAERQVEGPGQVLVTPER